MLEKRIKQMEASIRTMGKTKGGSPNKRESKMEGGEGDEEKPKRKSKDRKEPAKREPGAG